MARLTWDQTGERFYETGVSQGVLYPQDTGGTYPTGVAWNGLSSVSETPSGGEATTIWADNMKYLSLMSAEELGGSITAYTYPEEWKECDGSVEIVKGASISQQTRKTFGLCYRTIKGNDTEGDAHGYLLHIVYGAKASPSERQYQTVSDSPEAIELSWEYTTTPMNVTGHKPTSLVIIDSTTADPTKLSDLEDILYGSASGDGPRLPLPDEIVTLLTPGE